MGMAHRAPMSLSTTYEVFDEAVNRLREIVASTHQYDHQPNVALKHIIDDGVKEAIHSGKYRKIVDYLGKQVSDALLVELPDRIGKGIFAVVKPDLHGRKVAGGGVKQIVISVQDQEQVNWNLVNGKWKHDGQPGQAMAKLGAKMPKDILNRVVDSAAKKVEAETHRVRWKFVYTDEDGKPIETEFDDKAKFLEALQILVEEGGADDVKTFKEILVPTWVPAKLRVSVDLDE